MFQYCDQQSTPEGPLLTLTSMLGPSHNGIVTFTSDTLPNDLSTFTSTVVFNLAFYTTTVPDIDFFVAGAFACFHNPAPPGVSTFYSYATKEPYQNFLTCLNVSPTLPELAGALDCAFCAYVDTNCNGITTSECAQTYYGLTTTSASASTTTAAPTEPPTDYNPIISDVYESGVADQLVFNVTQSTATNTSIVYISINMEYCDLTQCYPNAWGDQANVNNLPMPTLETVLANGLLTLTSSAAPPMQANFSTISNGTIFGLAYFLGDMIPTWVAGAYACYNGGIGGVNTVALAYYAYDNYPDVALFTACYELIATNPLWQSGVNCDFCGWSVLNCPQVAGGNVTYIEQCITNYYQPVPVISAIFQDFIPDNVVIDVHTSTCGQSIVYVSAQLQLFNWDGSTVDNLGAFYAEEASIMALPLPLLSTVLAPPLSASLNFQTNITGLVFGVNPNRTIAVFNYYADSGGIDYVAGAIACNDGGFYYYSYTNKVELLWFVENYVTSSADPDILAAGLAFNCAFFNFGASNCALQALSNAACVAAYA